MIEKALTSKLVSDATIAGLIGSRFYPIRTPDNAIFPCAVYTRVSSAKEHTLEDAGNLTFSRFVIDSYASKEPPTGSFSQALTIGRAIQAALDGFRGIYEQVDIQSILFMGENHSYDSELEIYRVSQDWMVIHRE